MSKIFISYRRDDTQHQADRLYEQLIDTFEKSHVFMDIDNIPLGVDFAYYLDQQVGQCEVLLALMGRHWLSEMQRRAVDPADFVRIEIASALNRNIPVIPVLFDDAPMPRAEDLPLEIRALVRRNGTLIRRIGFRNDVSRLIDGLLALNANAPSIPGAAGALRETMVSATKARQEAFAKALSDRRAREAAEAEARRKAEEKRKAKEELERRLGPAVVKARQAAIDGKPVADRVFRLELPGVANWPKPEFVAIPSGTFLMGAAQGELGASKDEFPQHQVTIGYPFTLGKHAVTFAEWDAALAAGAKLEKPGDCGWGRRDRPVINVSWYDAQAYLAWLNDKAGLTDKPFGWRLPSEAEWEYACRAGTTTPFSFGATISTDQANYDGNYTYGSGSTGSYLQKTAEVGSYPANGFGLYDMHGNVWEWVEDCYQGSYTGLPVDGTAHTTQGCSDRVCRGGSWVSYPQDLRSAVRVGISPEDRYDSLGFRLARTLP